MLDEDRYLILTVVVLIHLHHHLDSNDPLFNSCHPIFSLLIVRLMKIVK